MSDTETRRIITVDIGRSTWQGYEGDEPVRFIPFEMAVYDCDSGEVLAMESRLQMIPNRLNIINLGEVI